jgi:hypothetical protein
MPTDAEVLDFKNPDTPETTPHAVHLDPKTGLCLFGAGLLHPIHSEAAEEACKERLRLRWGGKTEGATA